MLQRQQRRWRFLNTRPSVRAVELTHALTAHGVDVRQMPLLDIQPCSLTTSEIQYLSCLDRYDLIICVSPTAAQLGIAACDQHQVAVLTQSKVIAVGESTARIFRDVGIAVQLPTESSNEGMLAMSDIHQLHQNASVLIWRGKGGRRLLYNDLKARGVRVDSLALYTRQPPKNMAAAYKQHEHWANIVLISSGEAWKNWCSVCSSLVAYDYLVLGARIHKQVQQTIATADQGFMCDSNIASGKAHLIPDLHPETIMAVLQTI